MKADNLCSVGESHGRQRNLVFWMNFLLSSPRMVPELLTLTLKMSWLLFPKDLASIRGKIKDFVALSAITHQCILIFQLDKLLPRGGWDEKSWKKKAYDWLYMRSFHYPYLVGIGCNADFLSRFKVINPGGLKFAEPDRNEVSIESVFRRENIFKWPWWSTLHQK